MLWPSAKSLAGALAEGRTADVLFTLEPDGWTASGVRLTIVDAAAPGASLAQRAESAALATA